MYTRCQSQRVCLHSSNCLFALQQICENGIPDSKRPRETGGVGILCPLKALGLFGHLIPRRIERARIVDLGDLAVGEAEHLAQDLAGVLAARHPKGKRC